MFYLYFLEEKLLLSSEKPDNSNYFVLEKFPTQESPVIIDITEFISARGVSLEDNIDTNTFYGFLIQEMFQHIILLQNIISAKVESKKERAMGPLGG